MSSIGTFVKREHTSKLTNLTDGLMLIPLSFSIKSHEFLKCDPDIVPNKGDNILVSHLDNLYVIEPTELMIGRIGLFGL